jgi:hydroxypyruvate isomerase
VLLEPVNTTVDHPGMYLDTTTKGLEAVEAVASARVRLLWDMYHSAAMGEEPEAAIGNRMHLVAHVQAADHPGRNEPGSGGIDWARYMAVLKAKGYQGAIGLEYRPTGDSLASVRRAQASLGIRV